MDTPPVDNPTLKVAEPSKTLYVQVSIRVPEPLRRRAKIAAAKLDITLSQIMVHGLAEILEQLETNMKRTVDQIKLNDPLGLTTLDDVPFAPTDRIAAGTHDLEATVKVTFADTVVDQTSINESFDLDDVRVVVTQVRP